MLIPSKVKMVSSLKKHPYYRDDNHLYLPTVDGKPVDHAVIADAINGYVKCYVTDDKGNFRIDPAKPDRLLLVRRKGHVVIMQEKETA